jgi:hypothetical protein
MLILGDIEPSSGVGVASQTEWVMNKTDEYSTKRDIRFGQVEASAMEFIGGMGSTRQGGVGHFRQGLQTQTELTKPPSGKNMPPSMTKTTPTFFENPLDRFGTVTGTPTRQLNRADTVERTVERVFGAHYSSPSRFPGDSATSGTATPSNKP